MNICFLDNNKIEYNYTSLNSKDLRGAERVLINLVLGLNKLGHKITILNNTKEKIIFQNTRWLNINDYSESTNYDLAITNNDLNNLDIVTAQKYIGISYSLQTIEKFIRKKQITPFIKYRPKILLLGEYHKDNRNYLTRIFGSDVIKLAVDDIFLKTKLLNDIDKNKAIFTSYPDRNLKLLKKIWVENIFIKNNKLKLYATHDNEDFSKFNIFKRNIGSQYDLIKDLLNSRILLVPGHKAELFCIAAEEARELCVPIVTLGIGSLKERVIHNKTGFIAKNYKEFGDYTLELFNNDKAWNEIRENLINMRNSSNWNLFINDFLKSCI